jgi:hypothetical protein
MYHRYFSPWALKARFLLNMIIIEGENERKQ